MKSFIRVMSNEIKRTHQDIDMTIRKSAEYVAKSKKAFEQRRENTQKQINRIRNIIQNKEP